MCISKQIWLLTAIGCLCAGKAEAQPYLDALELTPQATRYIERFGDEKLNLYEGVNDAEPWMGTYTQDSEPKKDYCGPTAGKNALYWYGHDQSYSVLASEMRTNQYSIPKAFGVCQAACAALGILDPWPFFPCSYPCSKEIEKVAARGSLPKYVTRTLKKHAPPGYSLYSFQSNGSLEDILEPLSAGNPVVALRSSGKNNLHWVTIVGYYYDDQGTLTLRIANGDQVTWPEWKARWSMSRVTRSRVIRHILKDVGVYRPYTMMYFSKDASDWDVEYDATGVSPTSPGIGAGSGGVCQAVWDANNAFGLYKYGFFSTAGGPHCGYREMEEKDAIIFSVTTLPLL